MTAHFEFHFEWDAAKAAGNRRKHGVSFELAATVFRDPLMISIPDEEHSETEERWITMGQAENSKLLLVVHTYLEMNGTKLSPIVKSIMRQLIDKKEEG